MTNSSAYNLLFSKTPYFRHYDEINQNIFIGILLCSDLDIDALIVQEDVQEDICTIVQEDIHIVGLDIIDVPPQCVVVFASS